MSAGIIDKAKNGERAYGEHGVSVVRVLWGERLDQLIIVES